MYVARISLKIVDVNKYRPVTGGWYSGRSGAMQKVWKWSRRNKSHLSTRSGDKSFRLTWEPNFAPSPVAADAARQ